ncbi:RNA polymerase sigma factor [Paraburkholderia acidicola]|uniref:RNA polymerase sigma factor n=1 Tax=Paraburkholderia acidicola TaxID=1912599 RepID=A0ABV1LWE8_9BURK|nr:RNA polymerase sigma factor [Paraburkholderia acidicola]
MAKGLFDELVSGYHELKRVLTRELDTDNAADVAQSSFERALRYAQSHEVHSPRGLLFGIARNLQIDGGRRFARVSWQSVDEVEDDIDRLACSEVTPERSLAGRQAVDQLCDIIDALPPRCREAFVLCKLHHMTYEEAADEMGISPTVIRKYLVQALRECRVVLA